MADDRQIPEKWKELLKGSGDTYIFDSLKYIQDNAREKARTLPSPLPWIEPSINMPHLQACLSYMLGSSLGSILTTGVLLEHTLRIAVIDTIKGHQGAMDEILWKKYMKFSVNNFLDGGKDKKKPDSALLVVVSRIIPSEDLDWWRNVVDRIRNKVTHLDYPAMSIDVGADEEYMGLYTLSDRQKGFFLNSRSKWGFTFHRFDDSVARRFLDDATKKLRKIIANMRWQPDISNHISQKWEYESFFAFDWSKAGHQQNSATPG